MDTRRSYYLSYKQDDFAELDAETASVDIGQSRASKKGQAGPKFDVI